MSTILLVGSSIFEAWDNAAAIAPNDTVVNRAVGGTTTRYWCAALPTTLAAVNPDFVCFYCGSNDLNEDVPDAEIVGNLRRCRELLAAHPKAPPLAYFSIIKAPQKADKWERIDVLNQQIQALLRPGDRFVDLNPLFLCNGQAITSFYQEDQLHYLPAAYTAMVTLTRPQLQAWFAGAEK